MNTFTVTVKPGFEYHFKIAVGAFDPRSNISLKDGKFLVETSKLSLGDIKALTSVKEVNSDDNIQLVPVIPAHPGIFDMRLRSYTNFNPLKLTLCDLSDIFDDAHNRGLLYYDSTVYCEYNGNSFTHDISKLTCKNIVEFKKNNLMLNSLVTIKWTMKPAMPPGINLPFTPEFQLYCNGNIVPQENRHILRIEIRTGTAAVLHCS